MTAESGRHDYEPNDDPPAKWHPMASGPNCRRCGQSERSGNHG